MLSARGDGAGTGAVTAMIVSDVSRGRKEL
jgi:hypothetical protein